MRDKQKKEAKKSSITSFYFLESSSQLEKFNIKCFTIHNKFRILKLINMSTIEQIIELVNSNSSPEKNFDRDDAYREAIEAIEEGEEIRNSHGENEEEQNEVVF